MKQILAAAIALVIGLVLGGLGPRAQVRVLEDRVEHLEARDCSRGGGLGGGLATMLGERALNMPEAPPPSPSEPPPEPARAEEAGAVPEPAVELGVELDDTGEGAPDLGAVADMMEVRRAQAHQAMLEQVNPDEAQLEDFDRAMDEMNTSLATLAEELVHRVSTGEALDRRDSMVLAADALDVMIRAEDAISQTFSEEQREGTDPSALDPFSYVDASVVDRFASLDPEDLP